MFGWIEPFYEQADAAIEPGHIWCDQPIYLPPRHGLKIERVATPLGLLPEQVTDDGEPAWVVPLAWSHAMLLLAARPELDIVRSQRAGSTARAPV